MATLHSVVPANIRAEMARRGVTQKAVAAALGVTQQAVSQKINGRRPFSHHEIEAVAALLNIDAGALFADIAERSAS